jgi:hypothetical protein
MTCAQKFIAGIFSVLINSEGLDEKKAASKRDAFQILHVSWRNAGDYTLSLDGA